MVCVNNVFDGVSETLLKNANALVGGNLIKVVSTQPITAQGATMIDGGGRTLMPGLIDAHFHIFQNSARFYAVTEQPDYLYARMTVGARETLLRGFTTVRDIGGPIFGMKKAIDEGIVPGRRIFPAGPAISQTSGRRSMDHHPARIHSGA